MKKNNDLQQQIRNLNLKLIEVQTLKSAAPLKPIEDFKVSMGYVPEGYRTIGHLEAEEKILQKQIIYIEGEIAKTEVPQKKGERAGQWEHEKVKTEVERVRKIRPKEKIGKILDEVAENLGKTFEATQKAYYFKAKK